MEENDKGYFKPGDVVVLRQRISNSPEMVVVGNKSAYSVVDRKIRL